MPVQVRSERLQVCVGEEDAVAQAAGPPAASDKEGAEASTPEVKQEEGPSEVKQEEDGTPGPSGVAGEAQGAGAREDGPAAKRRKGQHQPWDAVHHVVCSKPEVDARGHTGYLTFARKFV